MFEDQQTVKERLAWLDEWFLAEAAHRAEHAKYDRQRHGGIAAAALTCPPWCVGECIGACDA
jgi:hypothetical protein